MRDCSVRMDLGARAVDDRRDPAVAAMLGAGVMVDAHVVGLRQIAQAVGIGERGRTLQLLELGAGQAEEELATGVAGGAAGHHAALAAGEVVDKVLVQLMQVLWIEAALHTNPDP